MYCNKCGKENTGDAVYCNKCGSLMEDEIATRVSQRAAAAEPVRDTRPVHIDDDGHREIFVVSPTLKFIKAGYGLCVLAALVLAALIAVLLPSVSPWIAVIVGLGLMAVPVFYHLRQRLVRYRLTDATVEIDRGLLSRSTQNIPLRRIQDVTVSATLLQRLLGFGDILIDNASEDGGKVVLDNIDSPRKYADMLLRQMRQLDR